MKHTLKIFILFIGFVLYFNVNSFANIDIAIYGGYLLSEDLAAGELSVRDKEEYPNGQLGAKAHYNIQLSPSMDLGLGAFLQACLRNTYYYDGNNSRLEVDTARLSFGLDVNLIFSVPSMPAVYPYVRGTYPFFNEIYVYGGGGDRQNVNGKGWGIGGGIEYSISPNVGLFAELMYEKSSYDCEYTYWDNYYYDYKLASTTIDLTEISVNVGIKYLIF